MHAEVRDLLSVFPDLGGTDAGDVQELVGGEMMDDGAQGAVIQDV